MTFKELLNSVQFEDVALHLVRMYPDMGNSLGWYKIHFDMLRLMQPVFQEDANDKVCKIIMKDWEDGSGQHLDAFPMEGDMWEHSLTKELIIAPDVKASNEELAACCLWHTSFYGFVEKHVDDRFRIDDMNMGMLDGWNNSLYYKVRALCNFSVIRKHGAVKYLYDLLLSYDMIPQMDGIVVRIVIGAVHEVLTDDEKELCNLLAEGRQYSDLILDCDSSLGNQVVISYAAYKSKNPLVM